MSKSICNLKERIYKLSKEIIEQQIMNAMTTHLFYENMFNDGGSNGKRKQTKNNY